MSNVHALPGKVLTAEQRGAEPNPEVIRYLKSILAEAEAGRIQAIGYAFVDHEGEISMREIASAIGDARDVMSGLYLLAQRVGAMINASAEES